MEYGYAGTNCAVCLMPLDAHADEGDCPHSLLCGHVYHTLCLSTYAQAQGRAINELKCPLCGMTTSDCIQKQQGGDTPVEVEQSPTDQPPPAQPSPATPSPLQVPPTPPASPDMEEEESESEKGKGKAKGKARGKATPKGKSGAAGKAMAKPKAKSVGKGKGAGKGKATAMGVCSGDGKGEASAMGIGKGKGKVHDLFERDGSADSDAPLAPRKGKGKAKPPVQGGKGQGEVNTEGEDEDQAAQLMAKGTGKGKNKLVKWGAGRHELGSLSEGMVFCNTCGRHEHFHKCRVVSKTKGTWSCCGCRTKCTQLYRKFGQWPTPDFEQISVDQQREFMSSLKGLDGPQACGQAIELLEQYRKEAEVFKDEGEYLPLEVYEKRGFDTTMIVKNTKPHNVRWCSVLGWTYRVPIMSTGLHGEKGYHRGSVVKKSEKKGGQASSSSAGVDRMCTGIEQLLDLMQTEKEQKLEEKNADNRQKEKKRARSSSSSSSTSSSSDEKKKKKKKEKDKKAKKARKEETPAERRAREKLEKVQADVEAKEHVKRKKLAQQLLVKLDPVVESMTETTNDEVFGHLPSKIRQPMKDALDRLLGFQADAKKVADAEEDDDLEGVDLLDARSIHAEIATQKKVQALAEQMMAITSRV